MEALFSRREVPQDASRLTGTRLANPRVRGIQQLERRLIRCKFRGRDFLGSVVETGSDANPTDNCIWWRLDVRCGGRRGPKWKFRISRPEGAHHGFRNIAISPD